VVRLRAYILLIGLPTPDALMKRRTGRLLLLLACPLQLWAQAAPALEHEAVRRAVLDYVEGFYERDSTKFVRSVRPEVYKFGFFVPRDSSRYEGRSMTWPEFHAFANRAKASGRFAAPTAPKEVVIYDVLDQTASAKLTAYWGIDYVLLGKFDGRWMITSVLWQTPPRG
jgi:hypothetical protein